MRRILRVLRTLLVACAAVLTLGAAALQMTGHGYFWRALSATYLQGYTTAHIDDAGNFAQRIVATGTPVPWSRDARYNRDALDPGTLDHLARHGTAAFLVAQNGALLHESYYAPYDADSLTNSFSVAKTITTMQVGLAAQQGIVSGFDAPLTERLPEYSGDMRGRAATVSQLSAMKAGHEWSEHYYLPLNITTELYFGGDAAGLVLRQGFERDPGSAFEYSSGSAQLLGVFLQRALAAREPGLTVSEHLSRSLWKPLGMARDAIYTLDREGGIERTYCCVFATARDFARLGQLLLQDGVWEGRPLLDRAFVERMSTPDLVPFYGHSLWMDLRYAHPFWFMQGHQGQYVIGVPSKRLVVVRTGRYRDNTARGAEGTIPAEVYRFVDQAVALAAR